MIKFNGFISIIGLEIHIQLKTVSKMFCGCLADSFGHSPNTLVCPVCLGLPGALPTPNKTAIDWTVKLGLALGCQINEESKFDRKNYFYPDLAKGYQISQYDKPFCQNGELRLKAELGDPHKVIGIRRVHLEEDTGRLIHKEKKYSLIDFNRSGAPLVEIVTEPDFRESREAVGFMKRIQQLAGWLDISDAEMEKGSMRIEPNISIRKISNDQLPGYKVEIKNINSFRFARQAIDYEIKRQMELLKTGKTPIQETRGWDEKKRKTVSQRTKEEASDYRYFPEPDIPPIKTQSLKVKSQKSTIGELPWEKEERYTREYGLSEYQAEVLTRDRKTAEYFEEVVRSLKDKKGKEAGEAANWLINRKVKTGEVEPEELLSRIRSHKTKVMLGETEMVKFCRQALAENKKAVDDYKAGKEQALKFLIGQVMVKAKRLAKPERTRELLIDMLGLK